MTSLFLILAAVCSFLFYGVVGQDKSWLLAPVFIATYGLVAFSLVQRAWRRTADSGRRSAIGGPSSVIGLPPSGSLWVLFLIYGIAMIPLATVPFESKLVLLFIGAVVGSYLIWGMELTTFKDNRVVVGFLIFVVMMCALYGLIIHFKCPDRVLWAERYTDAYEGRLRSTYICPNHFAHLMQMLLPFCVALLFIPQAGLYLKVLSVYSFCVFLPPMFLTESRAGWLGSLAAVGVTVCLMALRRSKKLFAMLVILVPLCSVLLLFGAWRYSETFQRRMQPVVEFLEGQADGGIGSEARDFRPQTWMDTIDMIKAAPLIGHGPGNYRYTYPEFRKRFRGQRIVTGHPHNEYLELLADYGLIGFALFALAWVYGVVWILIGSLKAEETRHAFMGFAFVGTVAGTMVHSFFDFQMHVFPNALVFALLAAAAAGPLGTVRRKRQRAADRLQHAADSGQLAAGSGEGTTFRARQTYKDDTEVVPPKRQPAAKRPERLQTSNAGFQTALYWLLAVGYVLSALFCLRTLSSAYAHAMGQKAFAVRSFDKAEQLHGLAAKLDRTNWEAYKGLGDVLYYQRRHCLDMEEKLSLAKTECDWFQRAAETNPKDPELLTSLGKTMVFLGRKEGGNLEDKGFLRLQEACSLRKFNDHYWWILGVELRKSGRYEAALEAFRHANALARTPSTRKNIEWLEARLAGVSLPKQTGDVEAAVQEKPNEPTVDLMDLFEQMDE